MHGVGFVAGGASRSTDARLSARLRDRRLPAGITGKPEMRDKISDPTTILVVAGYADAGGRADLNLRVSRERAESVTRALKEQANLLNAMQTIGMGGTDLLDSNRREQNRAVEVWAVVPW